MQREIVAVYNTCRERKLYAKTLLLWASSVSLNYCSWHGESHQYREFFISSECKCVGNTCTGRNPDMGAALYKSKEAPILSNQAPQTQDHHMHPEKPSNVEAEYLPIVYTYNLHITMCSIADHPSQPALNGSVPCALQFDVLPFKMIELDPKPLHNPKKNSYIPNSCTSCLARYHPNPYISCITYIFTHLYIPITLLKGP